MGFIRHSGFSQLDFPIGLLGVGVGKDLIPDFSDFFCGGGVIWQDFAEGSEGELDLDLFGVSHSRRSYKSPGEPQEG